MFRLGGFVFDVSRCDGDRVTACVAGYRARVVHRGQSSCVTGKVRDMTIDRVPSAVVAVEMEMDKAARLWGDLLVGAQQQSATRA